MRLLFLIEDVFGSVDVMLILLYVMVCMFDCGVSRLRMDVEVVFSLRFLVCIVGGCCWFFLVLLFVVMFYIGVLEMCWFYLLVWVFFVVCFLIRS